MDILEFLGKAVLLIAIAVSIIIGVMWLLVIAGCIVTFLWPLLLGIVGCVYFWSIGNDNVAVCSLIVGILTEVFWFKYVTKSSPSSSSDTYDWKDGKVKLYDKDGNVTGYKDSDR